MIEKGFGPLDTIQSTCDQGRDVNASFILPDGNAVSGDFREDPTTRQAVGITSWEPIAPAAEEDEYLLGAEILKDPRLRDAFDRAVLAYFDFHWRQHERPLPRRDGV